MRKVWLIAVLLSLMLVSLSWGLLPAQAAGQDNNVEWDGLGHDPAVNFCGDGNWAYRYFLDRFHVSIRVRVFDNDITAATLWYTSNPAASVQGDWTSAAMSWESDYNNCGGYAYEIWRAEINALTENTVYYKINYVDGTDADQWQRAAGECWPGSGCPANTIYNDAGGWTTGSTSLSYTRDQPTYVDKLALGYQGLGAPDSRDPDPTQDVTVYARSDTVSGEYVCIEWNIGAGNTPVQCGYSSAVTDEPTTAFHHSVWHCTLPAQGAGSTVNWQLYTATDCATYANGGNWDGWNSYSVASACTGDYSDIVIHEVMYDQVGGSITRFANGEWVELYNQGTAGTCVNLDNLRMDDQDNFPNHVFDFPNVRLFAGDYLVIYTGRPTQSSQAGPHDYVADFRFDDGVRPPMPPSGEDYAFVLHMDIPGVTIWNDSGDEVILYVENGGGVGYQSGTDTPVDYVEWGTPNSGRPVGFSWSCGGSNPSSTQGRSIGLIPGQPSGDCASWEESGSSGSSGYTGNGGNTRGPHTIGGPNDAPSGLGLVCDSGGSTPTIDGDIDGDAAWDYGGGTRYIPESEHAFPSPSHSSNTNSDNVGESSARTYWDGGTSPAPHELDNGDADVQHFWATADASYLYLGVSRVCAIWTSRYGGSDLVDLFIAIDTDNDTGAGVYHNSPLWSKRVDFLGWHPEYAVAVERVEAGNDYAALVQWSGGAWSDVRAGPTFAYGTYWAGDFADCTLEVRLPWADLGGQPANHEVWNFGLYTTHDDDSYDVYDSGPGIGITLFFEQLGDFPREADYPCGVSDPVDIAYDMDGGPPAGDEALCGDSDGVNLYQDSDNSYQGDDPLDGGNQPGSDNYGSDDVDTLAEYYAIEFDEATCDFLPTAVRLASFGASPAVGGILLAWETESEIDNLGFNLYRSASPDALGERLNEALIPSRSPGGGLGASYEYLDETALLGVTYYYTLEDVDAHGIRTPHGPVVIAVWRAYLPLVWR